MRVVTVIALSEQQITSFFHCKPENCGSLSVGKQGENPGDKQMEIFMKTNVLGAHGKYSLFRQCNW